MTVWTWLAIAGAGTLGSVLRYVLDVFVGSRTFAAFPGGTLTVNLSGSFLFGLLAGLGLYHAFPATPELVLGTGFCGAYTTFSTFALESVVLAQEGERFAATLNVGAGLLGGCLAAGAGLLIAAR